MVTHRSRRSRTIDLRSGTGRQQCQRARRARGRSADQAERRVAGFRQQSSGSLNVNYPIWRDPRCAPETSAAMRQHLQVQYDALGLGRVPEPAGKVSDIGAENIALMLETKPEVVSFHIGLPEPEVI